MMVDLFRLRLNILEDIKYSCHLSSESHSWDMVSIHPLMRKAVMDDDGSACGILAHFNVDSSLLYGVCNADIDVTRVEESFILD